MKWLYLVIAGVFETCWAVSLKHTEGFTKLWPSVVAVVGMAASFYFLSLALKDLPLGTAYAIWTGIGTVGTLILGAVIFREVVTLPQILCVGLIVAGIVGLKLTAH